MSGVFEIRSKDIRGIAHSWDAPVWTVLSARARTPSRSAIPSITVHEQHLLTQPHVLRLEQGSFFYSVTHSPQRRSFLISNSLHLLSDVNSLLTICSLAHRSAKF